MGKHKGAGRHRRGGKKGKGHNPTGTAASASAAPKPDDPPVLHRLRHADPQIRLAALTALLRSHPTSSTSPQQKQQQQSLSKLWSDTRIWQTVREKVVDPSLQLQVATAAAACLEHYVIQQQQHQPAMDPRSTNNPSNHDTMTVGWYLVLLGRWKEAHGHVQSLQQQLVSSASLTNPVSTTTSTWSQLVAWLSLSVRCLSALQTLVELNPLVSDRLARTDDWRRETFASLQVWLEWTTTDKGVITPPAVAAADSSNNTNSKQMDQLQSLREQAQALRGNLQWGVAGLWHALVDDNARVVEPWLADTTTTTDVTGMLQHISICSTAASNNNSLSPATRLHLVGGLLSVIQLTSPTSTIFPPQNLQSLVKSWLQLVRQMLVWPTLNYSPEYREAYQRCQEQERDSEVERNVLTAQAHKKESARSIARRLHPVARKAEATPSSDNNKNSTATAMEMDSGDGNGDAGGDDEKQSSTLPEDRTDYVDKWSEIFEEWPESFRSLELALELATNLVNLLVPNDFGDDDDEHMEQEDENDEMHPRKALVAGLVRTSFGEEGFVHLLNQISSFVESGKSAEASWPPPMLEYVVENVQSKVCACLSPLVADPQAQSATVVTQHIIPGLSKALASAPSPSVAGTLAGVLQLVQQEGVGLPSDFAPQLLDLCLGALSASRQTETIASAALQRELVVLLGLVLCDESTSDAHNRKGCQVLMEPGCATITTLVLAETLNVLMDMYSDDHRRAEVFMELNVLSYFQQSLPTLKQRISAKSDAPTGVNHLNRTVDEGEIEHWKEIAHNAGRFIQYKKGHGD